METKNELKMRIYDQLKQVEKELAQLKDARSQMISRMHYGTVAELLDRSGLPYALRQLDRDVFGKSMRNYEYTFTCRWSSDASIWVQETEAGRRHKSMGGAMDALDRVLSAHRKSLENAFFEHRLEG